MSELLKGIVKAMDDKLADEIEVLDFRGQSPFCDYFVIATAANQRQAMAIIDYVEDKVAEMGYEVRAMEGNEDSRWFLLDCHEVIVHVFVADERSVYNLEKLWGDLPKVDVEL